MEINLVTVSKLSSEIIFEDVIKIEHVDCPELGDLMDNIYDRYPALWRSDKYSLYWQYSRRCFLPIQDYLSYVVAIRLMNVKRIFLLLDDICEYWEDNYPYLKKLDCVDEAAKVERERDIYDVTFLVAPVDIEGACMNASDISRSNSSEFYPLREDEEILDYAVRNEAKADCYTTDVVCFVNLVKGLQQGFPKIKTELRSIPNVVFEKRVAKDAKGKKEADKNKGKGSKGDKKSGKKK